MMQTLLNQRNQSKLWTLFDEYVDTVNRSPLAPSSKTDYIMFAEFFMLWLEGNFEPGAHVRIRYTKNTESD